METSEVLANWRAQYRGSRPWWLDKKGRLTVAYRVNDNVPCYFCCGGLWVLGYLLVDPTDLRRYFHVGTSPEHLPDDRRSATLVLPEHPIFVPEEE